MSDWLFNICVCMISVEDYCRQIERTQVGGEAAEFRTRREAWYNRAVVPAVVVDRLQPTLDIPTDCGGIQNSQIESIARTRVSVFIGECFVWTHMWLE